MMYFILFFNNIHTLFLSNWMSYRTVSWYVSIVNKDQKWIRLGSNDRC